MSDPLERLEGFDPAKVVPDPDFRAPDLVGTVEGWRTWQVSTKLPEFGTAPKMYSVTYREYFWAPRKVSLAECKKCGPDVPGESCSCGFYSAKTLPHLLSMAYHRYNVDDGNIAVIGQLANWGKVIEGTQGWRSAKSYPVRLFVPFEGWRLAGALSEAYGVPVELQNNLEGM